MSSTVVRSPPCGISILICGAGVGGVMAALECWRQGCSVRIFERNAQMVTSGDSFTIGPTALNAFKHWPQLQVKNEEIAYNPLFALHSHTGERIKGPVEFTKMFSSSAEKKNVPHVVRHSRPKFHNMLVEQLEDLGIKIEYDKEIINYFEDEKNLRAGVELKDGTRFSADVVIAADGLRGTSWSVITGQPVPARSSGNAIFRATFPVDKAMADTLVAERFKLRNDGRSVLEMWIGAGISALFWRNQDQMIWSINHPDIGTAEESWNHRVSPDEVLKLTNTVDGWPEVANRVIESTRPDLLIDWKLMWRDPHPIWVSSTGRVLQLGDAAHTFLPSSGNGGTQAIEDAVSLAACLRISGRHNIPNALRVHNLLRFERVSLLQALGVANREARLSSKNGNPRLALVPQLGSWFTQHDPEDYAIQNYEKALAHVTRGEPFQNTNKPAGVEYTAWTIDELVKSLDEGTPTFFDADWS